MVLDAERRAFVAAPVMIVLGTRDRMLRPAIGRAVGARVVADDAIVLGVSAWQWPATVENLGANGMLAVTFARPEDYVSYQFKGRGTVREAVSGDVAAANRYIAAIGATLGGLGVPEAVMAPWFVTRDLVVVRFAVEEAFVQTPGPTAGVRLETAR